MFKHWIIHWKFGWLPKSPHPCTIAIYFCTWNLVLCLHFELKLQWLSSTYSIDLLLIYWHGFFTLRLGKHFCWGDWLCLVIFWSYTEDAGFLKMCSNMLQKAATGSCFLLIDSFYPYCHCTEIGFHLQTSVCITCMPLLWKLC